MNHPQQSKRHRKRHVPAGPAGLWMQTQKVHYADEKKEEEEEDPAHQDVLRRLHHPSGNDHDTSMIAMSPAWTAAHVQLGISTPSLPLHWTSSQKYEVLQRYYHDREFRLLEDLEYWKLQKPLLLQITSIQSISLNDHLWTLTLTDETNASITAWIQPGFVRHEQQTNELLREGNILLLQNCSLLLVKHEEYIILVAKEHIRQCFSAHQSDQMDHAVYIGWMEARNHLTMELREQNVIRDEPIADPEENDHDGNVAVEGHESVQHTQQREKDSTSSPMPPSCENPARTVTLEQVLSPPPPQPQCDDNVAEVQNLPSKTPTPPTKTKHEAKSSDSCKDPRRESPAAATQSSPVPTPKAQTRHRQSPSPAKRRKRKRSIFPSGCSNLLTKAAWDEMKQYIAEEEQTADEPILITRKQTCSPIFSRSFRNICPTFFNPDAFAGLDMEEYFDDI